MSSLQQILHTISYAGLPLIVAIVFHEYAHGWVAHRFGDPTAKRAGRLTMNPLAHIDPMGTIFVPLVLVLMPVGIVFGWAKPVPVNPGLLRNPRRDMALVAAAGPAMNFVLAIASGLLLRLLFVMDPSLAEYWPPGPGWTPRDDLSCMILLPLAAMALHSIWINLLLMVFNLIPIPPLDGGRVLSSLLPQDAALVLSRIERFGMLVPLGLIAFDSQLHVISTIMTFLLLTIVPAL